MSSKQLDIKAILMFASLAALAYVLFTSYNTGAANGSKSLLPKDDWGPMAGSGPGIAPEIVEAECPRHKQREVNIGQVDAYNPAAGHFASV